MTKKRLYSFALISLLFTLLGCQGAVTVRGGNALAGKQVCQNMPASDTLYEAPGITWFGITAGQSTKQDVLTQFGEPEQIISKAGTVPMEGICWMVYSDGFRFWISNEHVVGIEFLNTFLFAPRIEMPQNAQELYSLYGKPDFVGWHAPYNIFGHRYAIWTAEGIMTSIIGGSQQVASILYFPPMSQADFLSSNLSQFISFERTPFLGDMIEEGPQAPFDWGE